MESADPPTNIEVATPTYIFPSISTYSCQLFLSK